jgi:uncharacterized protein YegP (UPF0339 family)
MQTEKKSLLCPRIEIDRAKVPGQFLARMIAPNGREVWRTSEIYNRKSSALNAAKFIRSDIPVFDLTKK